MFRENASGLVVIDAHAEVDRVVGDIPDFRRRNSGVADRLSQARFVIGAGQDNACRAPGQQPLDPFCLLARIIVVGMHDHGDAGLREPLAQPVQHRSEDVVKQCRNTDSDKIGTCLDERACAGICDVVHLLGHLQDLSPLGFGHTSHPAQGTRDGWGTDCADFRYVLDAGGQMRIPRVCLNVCASFAQTAFTGKPFLATLNSGAEKERMAEPLGDRSALSRNHSYGQMGVRP